MSNTIEAKVIDGEMWIKADDHHWAVGEIEAEWRRRCDAVKQEAIYWHRRHDVVMDAVMKSTLLHVNPSITLMAEPQSYEAGRVKERKAMMQLFTDPENQPTQYGTVTVEYMQREIAAAVEREREACARIAERSESALHCAFNIRARGQA